LIGIRLSRFAGPETLFGQVACLVGTPWGDDRVSPHLGHWRSCVPLLREGEADDAEPCFQLRRCLSSDAPVALSLPQETAGSSKADSGELWRDFLEAGERLERDNAQAHGADADQVGMRLDSRVFVRRAALRRVVAGLVGTLAVLAFIALVAGAGSRSALDSTAASSAATSPRIELVPRLPGEVPLRPSLGSASLSLEPADEPPGESDDSALAGPGDLDALDAVLAPLCSNSDSEVRERARLARALAWAQQGRVRASSTLLKRLARQARTPAVRRQALAAWRDPSARPADTGGTR
jgi:hypothetical protein